eukprot:NODE_2537_length_1152_cov_50.495610_g2418_i0.p1 GENE.NODE_2537_length_1152_cov_50.495610_g2418_i0~~NODE_2537_length_1152_cov_50.495610_g2418_i0.p1  ORF type:complete len:365 (-),score=107.39 NODE_2537_length_1152_cov_50.495610_g2418_i0:56-1111(-)
MTTVCHSYEELTLDMVCAICSTLPPSVTELDLGGNAMGEEAVRALVAALPKLKSLKVLDLRDNKIRGSVADLFPFLSRLHHLDLSSNYIRDYGLTVVATALMASSNLAEIDLHDNSFGLEGVTAMAGALPNARKLHTLSLAFNHIGDQGAAVLAQALQNNIILTSLDVSDNQIGDPGATAFASLLTQRCALQHLNLSVNALGPASAERLGWALLTNSTLVSLDLGCHPLQEGCEHLIAALATHPTLTYLDLSNCELPAKCGSQLAAAMASNQHIVDLGLMWTTDEMAPEDCESVEACLRRNKERAALPKGPAGSRPTMARCPVTAGYAVALIGLAVSIALATALMKRSRKT